MDVGVTSVLLRLLAGAGPVRGTVWLVQDPGSSGVVSWNRGRDYRVECVFAKTRERWSEPALLTINNSALPQSKESLVA